MNRTRRSLVAVATASLLMLAACKSTSSGPDNAAALDLTRTTTPAASGTVDSITWALPYGEPTSLHWLKALAFSDSTVLSNLCEGLTTMTPDFGFQNNLAKTIKRPNDTTYVFELQPGVKFSNGDPMTPEDVVWSLSQNLDPNVGSFWGEWFKNISSIKATGPDEVTIKLSKPDAAFEQFLGTAGGAIVEKKYVEAEGAKYGTPAGGVMCTGPYQLDKWTPGQDIKISANPHYWDTAHAPKVQHITFQFITNATTLVDGLRTGEIDGSYEVPFSAINTLRSSGEGNLYLGKSLGYDSLEFTSKEGPTNDTRIRQALSLSMDRTAMAKAIFNGAATPIKTLFFPPTWGYGQDTFRKAYDAIDTPMTADLDQAKQLVSAVGPTATLKVLSNADDPTAKQLAAYVKTQAEAIGLKVQLSELPAAQYIASAFDPQRQKAYDLVVSTSGYLDVPDPIEWGVYTLSKGGVFNPSGYDNADVTKWVNQARYTTDPDARAALMTKVQEQAYVKDFASIGLVNTASVMFMNKSISGAPVSLNAHFYYPWARDLGGTS